MYVPSSVFVRVHVLVPVYNYSTVSLLTQCQVHMYEHTCMAVTVAQWQLLWCRQCVARIHCSCNSNHYYNNPCTLSTSATLMGKMNIIQQYYKKIKYTRI